MLEKYLAAKRNIDKRDSQRLLLAMEDEKDITNIIEFGRNYLTYEKRLEIIGYYEGDQDAEWIYKDLLKLHEKWRIDKIDHLDVEKFCSYDINITNFKQDKYKKSKVNILHSLILRGGRRE